MQCITHKFIAHKVFEKISAEFGIQLDYNSFLEGSVAPDNIAPMVIIPHTINKSAKLLDSQITLLSHFNVESTEAVKLFSYHLGIVIHLISDYFCKAHNSFRFLNPILHIWYENRLKKFFVRMKNVNFYILKARNYSHTSIRDLIEKAHLAYLKKGSGLQSDFTFSVMVSTIIAMKLVSANLKIFYTPEFKTA